MPKQFVPLVKDESLFQLTCKRVTGKNFNDLTIFTSNDYRFPVSQQLKDISISKANIFLEPEARNTGPSIICACQHIYGQDENAIVLALPADHYIPCNESFLSMINEGLSLVKLGQIVTFGVKPTRAETGYGYIELAKGGQVISFHEKPDASAAKRMLLAGNFLWNSGIFLMRAKDIVLLAQELQAEISNIVSSSLHDAEKDLDFTRFQTRTWNRLENISIDKAIAEKIGNLSCIPFKGHWSDLGDWLSVKSLAAKSDIGGNKADIDGNIISGLVTQVDVKNSLLESMKDGPSLGVLGLENVVVIADRDAVLVADISKSQKVRQLVEKMKDNRINEATNHFRDFRPWGWFEVLFESENYKVKRLTIYSDSALSLQSHKFRSEHWVVTEGEASVIIGDQELALQIGQSCYIPAGTIHRLTNNTVGNLTVIEVQTGSYLGEDDIERFDDVYKRN